SRAPPGVGRNARRRPVVESACERRHGAALLRRGPVGDAGHRARLERGRAGHDRGEHRPADPRRRPRRGDVGTAVDRQRLHADAGRADPARRLARRPVRPAADLRPRRGLVRRRLRALRRGADDRGAGRRTGPPGHRRCAAHPGVPGDHPGLVRRVRPAAGGRRLGRARGVAGAVGPFLGGWLIDVAGWRSVFLINLPLAVVTVLVALRHVPESSGDRTAGRFDVLGAALAAVSLTGITYALTELPAGRVDPLIIGSAVAGVLTAVWFVLVERRRTRAAAPRAMLPLDVFGSAQFTMINLITLVVYGGLSLMIFLLVVHLQLVAGFSPILAG